MEKELFIIRHGQTDLNLRGIVQGRGINSPLNETGFLQANAFYEEYAEAGFDRIYTSSLLRTHQTVARFVSDGIPWTQHAGLDEISWGIYEGKDLTPAILEGFAALTDAWERGDLDASVEGGESPNALVARQRQAMDEIVGREEDRKVLVCMHGRAMRVLLCWLTGKPVSQMEDFPHTNTALYRVRYADSRYEIVDAYNTRHLEGLVIV